jgi:hypothetical protein
MKRTLLAPALLLAALGASDLRAQAAGRDAPELTADVWLNFSEFRGKSMSQLRGSALLLEYWQTW